MMWYFFVFDVAPAGYQLFQNLVALAQELLVSEICVKEKKAHTLVFIVFFCDGTSHAYGSSTRYNLYIPWWSCQSVLVQTSSQIP